MTKGEILRTVRQKCLDCCCGQVNEVTYCGAEGCPLWPIRTGKDPTPSRTWSEERKQQQREKMKGVKIGRKPIAVRGENEDDDESL